MDPFDHAARQLIALLEKLGVYIPGEKRETAIEQAAILLRAANHAITREQQQAAQMLAERDGAV